MTKRFLRGRKGNEFHLPKTTLHEICIFVCKISHSVIKNISSKIKSLQKMRCELMTHEADGHFILFVNPIVIPSILDPRHLPTTLTVQSLDPPAISRGSQNELYHIVVFTLVNSCGIPATEGRRPLYENRWLTWGWTIWTCTWCTSPWLSRFVLCLHAARLMFSRIFGHPHFLQSLYTISKYVVHTIICKS